MSRWGGGSRTGWLPNNAGESVHSRSQIDSGDSVVVVGGATHFWSAGRNSSICWSVSRKPRHCGPGEFGARARKLMSHHHTAAKQVKPTNKPTHLGRRLFLDREASL